MIENIRIVWKSLFWTKQGKNKIKLNKEKAY